MKMILGTNQPGEETHQAPTTQSGFSLIELLIVLVLLGIFAAVAMPSFQRLIASNRLESATDELISHLQFARSEAVVNNRLVTVENTSGQNQRWDLGLRVYTAGNFTANRTYDASTDTLIREHTGLNQPRTTARASNGATSWLSFRPNGTLAITSTQTIVVCEDNNVSLARAIELQASGRISKSPTTPTTCAP